MRFSSNVDIFWRGNDFTSSYLSLEKPAFDTYLASSYKVRIINHLLNFLFWTTAMKIAYCCIQNGLLSHPWTIRRMQFWWGCGVRALNIKTPVASRHKATGRLMLFQHFWNMQFLNFTPNASSFILFCRQRYADVHK